ncbi:6-phosphogluconolactonase [Serratia sp. UGAL515B_01]|uniref:6-phosphogluconolactonase n=1 Tax=Serratia sp. UGAL515B_01 TaxID=2986763 RepID=UPI00295418E8|nr:6-phosphogluconolactonase [Serratia sp. UGAL515B_01]WON75994.1 6-phosphogluconolactonase [Serratia sp. UGAL515B_01]
MKIEIFPNVEQLNRQAANHILHAMRQYPHFNFAPTGGSSPLALYQLLIPNLRKDQRYQHVHYYTQDEVPFHPFENDKGAIYHHLQRHLFAPAGIPDERIHALNGSNYLHADRQIAKNGGIDLLLLGLGSDGHIAANLPGTPFDSKAHKIAIDRKNSALMALLANEVGDEERVPDAYFSLGIKTIMQAKNILLLVTGEKKAQILKQALEGPLTEDIPASILRLHPACTLFADITAAQRLQEVDSIQRL